MIGEHVRGGCLFDDHWTPNWGAFRLPNTAEAWPEEAIVQQAVGRLPWGHNLVLLSKLKTREERLAYAFKTLEHNWSRNVLVMQIETRLLERQGNAVKKLLDFLPESLRTSLPSIKKIKRELEGERP
ncbi:DUF1016 N-terminal domain-containing protein [Aminomonas paucivorans]|uniref:DUF1016 N-terminal domain-containing protein n=1 Tax=Aminomonas paucivorans TaxID=81412 RepID=UPI0018DD4872|nr:DUF1016 N-terminal domain-containing protein [Aminomonas paucivorans]